MTHARVNARVGALLPSGIRAIQEHKRPTSIDLSVGQPSLRPDPQPLFAAARWVEEHGCAYPPYAGFEELRELAGRAFGARSAANVCVTNGSQEAIYLAIKTLLEPGRDEALVVDPGYPSYPRCCALEGVAVRAVRARPEDGFRIHAEVLIEALTPATRLIALGSPANPSGAVFGRDDIGRLAQALRARTGEPVYVLVDEVYRELCFGPQPFASLADEYEHTIVVQSLSKSCALTGLRLGFLIGPADIIGPATRAHTLMFMSTSVPAQRAAIEILREPETLRAH
ncbi:MAG TPA: pyridoxal phosphate-dependent aminotransferase, partial [Candidatus Eremiobacteraceae bacterium]|nr:pyridoxal phosphate-dependent aminotransferase [Candidatus Eremiobacteraceae bacterium]